MTFEEKIEMTTRLVQDDSEATEELISAYLSMAEDICLNRYCPFEVEKKVTLPEKYDVFVCILASRLFSRRGGLGETSHNENGVNRTWANASDEDVLSRIIPMVKVVR